MGTFLRVAMQTLRSGIGGSGANISYCNDIDYATINT
jgi:hypothetical protein